MAAKNAPQAVFMTPEESERVRKTAKTHWQTCEDLKGQKRMAVPPKSLSQEVVGADLMADISGPSKDDKMPAIAFGAFYPPCIEELKNLKPMRLSELQMETHHRGKFLTLKCNAPVIEAAAYRWTVVDEKSTGEAERFQVYLPTSRLDYILDEGEDFVLKEPYYTLNDQGAPTIRVDHPSDMILAPLENDNKSAESWKNAGNTALKKQDLWKAHESYTRGLIKETVSAEFTMSHDIHRNRSHVNLLLNRFSEAQLDSLAAITGKDDPKSKDLDGKANFRAGRAAYRLEDFDKAKQLFETQLKLSPGDKDAEQYLRSIEVRRKETAGDYDLKRLKSRISTKAPRVDAASFTKNTEVKTSPGAGRGLFATKDIAEGEMVFCEKAFCVVWSHEPEAWSAMTYDNRDDRIRVAPAGLRKAFVQKLSNNFSQVEKVMDLFGDYEGVGKELIMKGGEPIVDVFRIHDIICRNAFGPGPITTQVQENVQNASTGLWVWAAYVNHSCTPNAKKEYVGDLMILRATRKIEKGEEIFHAYDESPDYDTRQAALMTTWDFHCSCPLCKVEEQDDLSVRKQRSNLLNEAHALIQNAAKDNVKSLAISNAKRLAKAIESTYDMEKYKDLPKLALVDIQNWLKAVTGGTK